MKYLIWKKIVKYIKRIKWLIMHRSENVSIVFTSNLNIKEKANQDNAYNDLYKKYKFVIDNGVNNTRSSEKSNKVWICWFQGLENAPELVKCCVSSVKKNFSDKEIIILSEENVFDYVHLPEYVIKKWKSGIIPPAHFSDLIRIDLLCSYGGIWCDATVLCTETPPSHMTDGKLFVFKEMDLLRWDKEPIICSSWYIESWSQQRILLLTRKLLLMYWEKAEKLENYFLCHLFLAMAARRYPKEWEAIPVFNNRSPHTLQFELNKPFTQERWEQLLKMSPLHKLNHHNKYDLDGTLYGHVLEEYKPVF